VRLLRVAGTGGQREPGWAAAPGGFSVYRFVWAATRADQAWLCLVTLLVVPVSMVPLELQRRITNEAIGRRQLGLLALLGLAYLAAILLQGWLKYRLNVRRGRVVEAVALELRRLVHAAALAGGGGERERGALVSMVAAEAEDVAGFVAESLSVPLLQGGTVLATLAYLLWVQPLLAALATVLYLPELVIVPWRQRTINRLGRLHVRLVRALGDALVTERGRASPAARRFPLLAERALAARVAAYRVKFFLTFLGNLLDAAGPLGVLVVGGWLVVQGRASMGALVVAITALQKVGDPLDQLMTYYRTAQNARVKYELLAAAVGERPRRGECRATCGAKGGPPASSGTGHEAGRPEVPAYDTEDRLVPTTDPIEPAPIPKGGPA
jgi:ABC-type multidrug transport system fused ATPase/permease subunit